MDYRLGLDGLNLWLVLLSTFLVPLTMLATWNSLKQREGVFAALFLLLETGVLGALLSQDMLFFYLFWEGMLIPTTFMIGIWGGEDRRYAGTKYFLYLVSGSLVWLVGLLYLAAQAGSFAPELMAQARRGCPSTRRPGSSSPSSWPSPSSSPSSRSTPGCRTPTRRRPRRPCPWACS